MIQNSKCNSFTVIGCLLAVLSVCQPVWAQNTWTWRNPSTPGDNISSIVWANNQYVAVTNDFGFILTSPDGVSWTHRFTANDNSDNINRFHSVIWTGDKYIVVGGTGHLTIPSILTSPDGITWTGAVTEGDSLITGSELKSILWTGSKLIAVGHKGTNFIYQSQRNYISSDGNSWTLALGTYGAWNFAINTDSLIIAFGDSGIVSVSEDGLTWAKRTPVKSNNYKCAIWTENGIIAATQSYIVQSDDYGQTWSDVVSRKGIRSMVQVGDTIIAVGDSGKCSIYDGSSWSAAFKITENDLQCVTWTGDKFVAGGRAGTLLTSIDGVNWTQLGQNFSQIIKSIIWTGSQFVGVGGNIFRKNTGTIVTSPDGITWTGHTSPTRQVLNSVASDGQKIVAVGDSGYILTSIDGENWSALQPHTTNYDLNGVVWGNNEFLLVGEGGSIYTSPNGTEWTKRNGGTMNQLNAVVWSGSIYMAVGSPGCILTSPDGVNWEMNIPSVYANLYTVASSGTHYMIGGNTLRDMMIFTSDDAINWTQTQNDPYTFESINNIVWDGHQYLVTGEGIWSSDPSIIYTTQNGSSWTAHKVDTKALMRTIAFNDEQYVLAGDSGIIFTSPREPSTEVRQSNRLPGGTISKPRFLVNGNHLHLKLHEFSGESVTIRIYGLNGRLEANFEGKGPEMKFSAGSLRQGNYILKVTSPRRGTIFSKPFMITR